MAHFRDKERTDDIIQKLGCACEALLNSSDYGNTSTTLISKAFEFDAENKYHRTACKICNP